MRWVIRSAVAHVISSIPGGEAVAAFIRKRITRSSQPTRANVEQKAQVAMEYLAFLYRLFQPEDVVRMTHVDIGAGWMPVIPLVFYYAGVRKQVLCDIRRHMDLRTVAGAVTIFRELVQSKGDLFEIIPRKHRRLPPQMESGEQMTEYFARLGMRYAVPFSPMDFSCDEAPKVVTATQVLQYLTRRDLESLLVSVKETLSHGGGILFATVRLDDPYSHHDPSVSRYNKYRYSDFVWDRVIGSRLSWCNRLTASDYRQLFETKGFEFVRFDLSVPTDEDLKELRRVPIHPIFWHVPEAELASTDLFLAARIKESHADLLVLS